MEDSSQSEYFDETNAAQFAALQALLELSQLTTNSSGYVPSAAAAEWSPGKGDRVDDGKGQGGGEEEDDKDAPVAENSASIRHDAETIMAASSGAPESGSSTQGGSSATISQTFSTARAGAEHGNDKQDDAAEQRSSYFMEHDKNPERQEPNDEPHRPPPARPQLNSNQQQSDQPAPAATVPVLPKANESATLASDAGQGGTSARASERSSGTISTVSEVSNESSPGLTSSNSKQKRSKEEGVGMKWEKMGAIEFLLALGSSAAAQKASEKQEQEKEEDNHVVQQSATRLSKKQGKEPVAIESSEERSEDEIPDSIFLPKDLPIVNRKKKKEKPNSADGTKTLSRTKAPEHPQSPEQHR